MRLFKTRRRAILVVSVTAYALLMFFGGCANKLILFPSTGSADADSAHQVFVPLSDGHGAGSGGNRIEVWVDRSPGAAANEPIAYSIEFIGNASRAEWVASSAAQLWRDRPVEVWMVNYPGYGQSSGKADLNTIAPAALAVYDHVAELAKGKPILTGGNSLGTTAALYVASQRPVAGLILQNPPALRSLILGKFGWWNLWLLAGPVAWQIPIELDSPTNAAIVKSPAIFLLADDDDFVVPWNQMKVVEAYAGEKKIIHMTGGHNDGISASAARELEGYLDWLMGKRNKN